MLNGHGVFTALPFIEGTCVRCPCCQEQRSDGYQKRFHFSYREGFE